MSAFPLFHLPLVPIRCILDMAGPADKVRLSLTSKKTYQIIKANGKSVLIESLSDETMENLSVLEKIDLLLLEIYIDSEGFFKKYRPSLTIEISDDIKFDFNIDMESTLVFMNIHVDPKYRRKRCRGIKGNWKIGNANLPVKMDDSEMHTFWKNRFKGFQIIGDWLKQVFKPQIDIIINGGYMNDFSENLRLIVDWINQLQTVQVCTVELETKLSDEDFKLVLDNVHPIESLHLHRKHDLGFCHFLRFTSSHLKINANWFTLGNLLMAECQDIWLYNSKLTYEDFTEYLKQWLAGKFSCLKKLRVGTQELFYLEQIINGLPNGYVTVNGRQVQYTFTRENGSISLKRNDGKVAKILALGGYVDIFDMSVSNI